MKIGIVTLTAYSNYGNRLQNYALEQVLINMGHDVNSVVFEFDEVVPVNNTRKKPFAWGIFEMKNRPIIDRASRVVREIDRKIHKERYKILNQQRENTFKKFTDDCMNEKRVLVCDGGAIASIVEEFDYFVTGSDQVWNPNYLKGKSFNFLTFFDGNHSIAYAPSIGVDNIPLEYVERYKEWIGHIKYLSAREESGTRIIQELIGKNPPVLVDPTLLLTKEEWLSATKKANNRPTGKYLLTYFLGEKSQEYKKQINQIAKRYSLEIINLSDIKDKETYCTGPSEFIDYVNNCSVFLTDSFHGTVFSILLEKPFVVYRRLSRISMYSRIETLLEKFKLQCREAHNIEIEKVFDINFSHVDKILDTERDKSFNYLNEALSEITVH